MSQESSVGQSITVSKIMYSFQLQSLCKVSVEAAYFLAVAAHWKDFQATQSRCKATP